MLALSDELVRMSVSRNFTVKRKADGSPVTTADLYADQAIKSIIKKLFGESALVCSEEDRAETEDNATIQELEGCFVIDPIDGTEYFMEGGRFCINIAYCKNREVIFGLIVDAGASKCYFNIGNHVYVHSTDDVLSRIYCKKITKSKLIVISVSINTVAKDSNELGKVVSCLRAKGYIVSKILISGACLKYLDVIKGEADLAVTFGSVMGWDFAPIIPIAEALGYIMLDKDSKVPVPSLCGAVHKNHLFLAHEELIKEIL